MKTYIYNESQGEWNDYKVEEEKPLLDFLLGKLTGQSRSKIKATLQGHGIRVDKRTETQFDFMLKPGMVVSVSKTKRNKDILTSRYVRIVYEDDYLVVVEKQVGILSMAAGHHSLNVKTVLDEYFRRSKQRCQAHVVHRLDRDTSGLMIYAKDKQTEQLLEHAWKDIVYDRRYIAVLSGAMREQEGTVANWLKDNQAYFTYSSPLDNGGKYAVTHFFVVDRTPEYSLVEFKLDTGRKNQIRVHAGDLGHPVCGDPKYGNGDDPCGRLALHAFLLCFEHPVTHERMEFESPIPYSFKKIFEQNKKNMKCP
ncbi:MAG: RluA family pseudouridine synthase [Prevotella sp.]|nr:RluA family pseudouridine synthase [Prevotella sp.]